MSNKTNTQCCNQNCRQGRDCPLRKAKVIPYYHPTSEGLQLQHWEVVTSTPKHDVIEMRATEKAAHRRAQQINSGDTA